MEEREDKTERERVLLVGVDTGTEEDFDAAMLELQNLAEACGMQVTGIITQRMEAVNKALYIGTGKVAEVREYAAECQAELVVFEDSLSPAQLKNLQEELELPVMDRTNLILDIFATRAKSREAKLQVEVARLKYLLPRLVGMHAALSRQGGTSGSMSNRGAGEKKLELDRRRIEHRISELNRELSQVEQERKTQRKRRISSGIPQVSLAGYTNAGKSTLMNIMVDRFVGEASKRVLEKDMLFATLETAVRKIDDGKKKPFYLADTVGFLHKLPHGLVQAFHSTLEEVQNADLILHVVDFSDPHYKQHMAVTEQTLKELDAGGIPVIYVYNKADLCMDEGTLPKAFGNRIYMSAKTGVGLSELMNMIEACVYAEQEETAFLFPYDKGNGLSYLCEHGEVRHREYREDGVLLVVNCHRSDKGRFAEYITEWKKA